MFSDAIADQLDRIASDLEAKAVKAEAEALRLISQNLRSVDLEQDADEENPDRNWRVCNPLPGVNIVKRPGADYSIQYMDVATGEIESMSIFGAKNIQEAIKEAEYSLTAFDKTDWFEILEVSRDRG